MDADLIYSWIAIATAVQQGRTRKLSYPTKYEYLGAGDGLLSIDGARKRANGHALMGALSMVAGGVLVLSGYSLLKEDPNNSRGYASVTIGTSLISKLFVAADSYNSCMEAVSIATLFNIPTDVQCIDYYNAINR